MPNKKLSGNSKYWKLRKCANCKVDIRRYRKFKGKFYCWKCYRKKFHMLKVGGLAKNSLEEALLKIYTIRGFTNKKGYSNAVCSFPQILAGHKIKILLVE